jgi:hypothetical protein
MPLDLDRKYAPSLARCIQFCHPDVNCQAITYRYDVKDNTTDNCWLKTATAATRRINEPASKVTVVSVFKPSYYAVSHKKMNQTCEQVKQDLLSCECAVVNKVCMSVRQPNSCWHRSQQQYMPRLGYIAQALLEKACTVTGVRMA